MMKGRNRIHTQIISEKGVYLGGGWEGEEGESGANHYVLFRYIGHLQKWKMDFQGLSIDSVNVHTRGGGVRLITQSYSR